MPCHVSFHFSARTVLSVAAIIAGTSACSSVTAPEAELEVARQLWADRGPASYSFTVARACFCPVEMAGPVVVTVRSGVIESRTYSTTGESVSATFAEGFPAVDGLFDFVEKALREADHVRVRYHATLGYPEQIDTDWYKNSVDDELGIVATNLIRQ